MADDEKVLRILLAEEQIRRIDALILSGVGGFPTRNQFLREAAEMLLAEYTYGNAPPEPRHPLFTYETLAPEASEAALRAWRVTDLDGTMLRAPARGYTVVGEGAPVRREPLFGLHNRDYPSLWAAVRVAELTADGSREVAECVRQVTNDAWHYGQRLTALEKRVDRKLTALFPTNVQKRQSAEAVFRNFAVGGCATTGKGIVATGPLFEWGICKVTGDRTKALMGLTAEGYDLLEQLDGISLHLPHSQEHAQRFFAHLDRHDPEDWWGFRIAVEAAAQRVTRDELVETFSAQLTARADQAATYAAGYIARTREWGLVEEKQQEGRYVLTAFGEEQSSKLKERIR